MSPRGRFTQDMARVLVVTCAGLLLVAGMASWSGECSPIDSPIAPVVMPSITGLEDASAAEGHRPRVALLPPVEAGELVDDQSGVESAGKQDAGGTARDGTGNLSQMLEAAALPPDLGLSEQQRGQLALAYERFSQLATEIMSERARVTSPLMEEKLERGEAVYHEVPNRRSRASGEVASPAQPARDDEFWLGKLERDPATGRKRFAMVVVGPGESEALDRLSTDLAVARAGYRREVSSIMSSTR